MSLGILDDVKFTHQTVEVVIVLSAPCDNSIWLKDGRRVAPSDHPLGRALHRYHGGTSHVRPKYDASVDESGLVHTLVVSDVRVEDGGIYTFRVGRPGDGDDGDWLSGTSQSTLRYRIEGSDDSANVQALMRGLAERDATASGTVASTKATAATDFGI